MSKEVFNSPLWETIINRATFYNEEIIVYPHRELFDEGTWLPVEQVLKFLFGEGVGVREEKNKDGGTVTIITGANFALRGARTVNADWTYKEVKPKTKRKGKRATEERRMTYRELAEWLAKGNGQCTTGGVVATLFGYNNNVEKDNRELSGHYKIRRWGSDEWIEPTVDIYEEDCKR